MKLISRILLLVICVVGILIATQNTELVKLTYIPAGNFSPLPQGASIELPLFMAVLAALLVGAFLTGFGTAIEHTRLRAGLRKQTKVAKRASEDKGAAESELDVARRENDVLRHRLESADAQLRLIQSSAIDDEAAQADERFEEGQASGEVEI